LHFLHYFLEDLLMEQVLQVYFLLLLFLLLVNLLHLQNLHQLLAAQEKGKIHLHLLLQPQM
jgi:hypothetical protein